MNNWRYLLALITFLFFIILWMTFQTSAVEALDKQAFHLLLGNKFISMFHYLGGTKTIFGIAIILILFIWLRMRKIRLMLFVLFTVGIGYGIYQLLKRIIERPRPEIVDQFSTFSFPSGHATHGILLYLTIAYVLLRAFPIKSPVLIWGIALLLTLLIGLSRISDGRHYASDILAGWMLGYSWFAICVWWYEKSSKKEQLNPE